MICSSLYLDLNHFLAFPLPCPPTLGLAIGSGSSSASGSGAGSTFFAKVHVKGLSPILHSKVDPKYTNSLRVVMGTQGKTGVERALLGSVAENVVRYAKKPVLVIPSNEIKQPSPVQKPFFKESTDVTGF